MNPVMVPTMVCYNISYSRHHLMKILIYFSNKVSNLPSIKYDRYILKFKAYFSETDQLYLS